MENNNFEIFGLKMKVVDEKYKKIEANNSYGRKRGERSYLENIIQNHSVSMVCLNGTPCQK